MLRKNSIPAYYHCIGMDSHSAYSSSFTLAFSRKIRWKLFMIYEILRFGYSVLYIDSDVVLLKNPFPYLYAINGYDIIAQSDLHGICSGFMFVKPTNQTVCAFEKAIAIAQNVRIDDQTAINEALKETNTSAFQLPKTLFPTGYDFFIKYQYYWDRQGIL